MGGGGHPRTQNAALNYNYSVLMTSYWPLANQLTDIGRPCWSNVPEQCCLFELRGWETCMQRCLF